MKTETTKEPKIETGRYRTADQKAGIAWELKPTISGLEFSATGSYDGGGGQNIEEIASAYPDDKMIQRIAKVWRTQHLNGMRAATKLQQRCLDLHASIVKSRWAAGLGATMPASRCSGTASAG